MPELKKFWLSDAEDKERSSKFVLNGLADFDDENDFNDDFVGGGGGAGRWNLEDVELQKQKLESGIFGISVTDGKWKYRGEGGANLVISLADEKQVLRPLFTFSSCKLQRSQLLHHKKDPIKIK